MGFGTIKLDKADKVFSQYIRLRDKKCMRCKSVVQLNENDLPISHQASHYFGRGAENTRYDPENVDCLCASCHKIWGSTNREAYRDFKIKQLGQASFDLLIIRSNTHKKRDREASYLNSKELLKNLM